MPVVTREKIQTTPSLPAQLPKIWRDVAGILKKKVNPLNYQKKIRMEWNKRLRNLNPVK